MVKAPYRLKQTDQTFLKKVVPLGRRYVQRRDIRINNGFERGAESFKGFGIAFTRCVDQIVTHIFRQF